jgi:hypothetical protein
MVSNPVLDLLSPEETPAAIPASPVHSSPPSTVASAKESETFGIPESATFLRSMLAEVRKLIDGKGIAVEDVFHNQYQEVYHFKRAAESARVDISYNGKNKITGVVAPHLGGLGSELAALLSLLKGKPLFAGGGSAVSETSFSKQFLNDFHEKVLGLCDSQGITIQKVVEQQWSQRYSFSKDGAVAVYDVWYNGKDRFTKCQPVITACSPGPLVGAIGHLLTEGMRG